MTSRKIVAVFETQDAAENAREGLVELGLEREQISIVDQSSSELTTQSETQRAGFWPHLKAMFMPNGDRATLEESLRRGGSVLTATVDDEDVDEAIAQLERAGAIDLDQREAQWRTEGWTGPATESDVEAVDERGAEERIPVVEERLLVGKREVDRGGVRVRSYIVEEPVHEQVQLREEHVEVERRPVNAPTRPVAKGSPDDLLQERTLEVTETAEEPVIAKEARVTEEVRVRKTAEQRVQNVDDTVRRTEVDIEDTRAKAGKSRAKPNADRPGRT
jgi:uncharacterized protein (TIGR02271 family)